MRYSGRAGVTTKVETAPGVWEDAIDEIPIMGTLKNRTEAVQPGTGIHPEMRTTTMVSILAPGPERKSYTDMLYLTLGGKRWAISSVVHRFPRLELYLGEVYNGPTP